MSGCLSQGEHGVITQYVCPDRTIVDNPDDCPKQEEPQYAKPIDVKPVDVLQIPQYEDLDCSKPENQNITYVKVSVRMESNEEAVNPMYRWYPSLNEGRINWIGDSIYNEGCTKIFVPDVVVYSYIIKGNKVLFYNGGIEILGGTGYAYPIDFMAYGTGYPNLVVNERGTYKAVVIVRDGKTGEIIGGNEAEFEM